MLNIELLNKGDIFYSMLEACYLRRCKVIDPYNEEESKMCCECQNLIPDDQNYLEFFSKGNAAEFFATEQDARMQYNNYVRRETERLSVLDNLLDDLYEKAEDRLTEIEKSLYQSVMKNVKNEYKKDSVSY